MYRIATLSFAVLLTGCAYNSFTPNYDAHFGEAVRAANLSQTLNPSAPSAQVPQGLDGASAREAINRYEQSFKTPPGVVNVINIGGQVGGQGGDSGGQ
jgi:hypothetical protein